MTALAVNIGSFLLALVAMEGIAWAVHRFIMHGPLWRLHASHHRPGRHGPEWNDAFGGVFALLTCLLFWWGAQPGRGAIWWAAAGVSTYGLLYALVHDGMAHRRFPAPWRPARGLLRRLVQAHHLHHQTSTRDGAVSFGFMLPRDVAALKRRLREQRRQQAEG